MTTDPIPFPQSPASVKDGRGAWLVIASAVVWSFGGAISRFLPGLDSWTVIFWRSFWACAFLLAFLFIRDGRRGFSAFREMGWPGLIVAVCFAVASTSFVTALQYTSVAKVVLIGASVPLVAALISRLLFGERIAPATWAAIAAVIAGVAIMVSDSLGDSGSMAGNLLAMLIALVFAVATVTTRRYSGVRMTPAVAAATALAALAAFTQAGSLGVSPAQMSWLFTFGALNLGLGMALFVTGARLIPAPNAALFGTLETVLGPVWVWLIHNESASPRVLLGGAIVLAALFGHLMLERLRAAG
jgi:drug/metabolite transporter (DMT)-like permease